MPTRTLVAGAVLAMLTIGACERREAADTTGAIRAPAAGDTVAESPATAGELSDANIVALLDEANKADSAAGALAVSKGTSADVKQFGKLMMSEHHALRVQGERLAKKLGVTPEPPAEDPVQAAAKSEMAALESAPKGPEFDRTYIQQEITIHKAVLDLAEQAHGATQNQELKALIEKAKPFIEKHLERAEEIQKVLERPAA